MSKDINELKKYLIEIEVDEEILREECNISDDDFEIEEAIEKEFGWLYKSGIYLSKIKKRKPTNKISI